MATHDRSLRSRRDVVFAREGAGAVHIRVTEPAGTDSIPDGEITDRGPDPNNPPFDLVATNKKGCTVMPQSLFRMF